VKYRSSQGIAAAGDPESENASSPAEVAMGLQLRLRFEQEAKLLRKSVAQVARRDKRIQARELEIKNLEAVLEAEANTKKAAEDRSAGLSQELENMHAQFLDLRDERVEQRCAEMDAHLDALSIYFDEELYPHMLTAIAGRRWVIGRGLRLAVMKCGESLELRQAFADAVSAVIAKGLSEGLRHGLEHGQAQLSLESIEAYDPGAEAKIVAALQALKDLKNPIYATSLPAPLSSPTRCTQSRAEKKKKCRIVCRTHGVGSAHHARSDGVPLSAPTVVPQAMSCMLHYPTPLSPHKALPILVLAFHPLLRNWRHCCDSFWAEAKVTTAYLINRSPSTALEKKTHMDLWSGHLANYEMLRIFKSGKEVEFEVELQGSRVKPIVDPHTVENLMNEDEEQDEEPQQHNLDNYVLVCKKANRTTSIPA
nr:retrovirus-related Pol polyprotein from transposon TNT 1-94 [Tanacetum cinerariifolium]